MEGFMSKKKMALPQMPLTYQARDGGHYQIWGQGFINEPYTPGTTTSMRLVDFIRHLVRYIVLDREVFIRIDEVNLNLFIDPEGMYRTELGQNPFEVINYFVKAQAVALIVRQTIAEIFTKGTLLQPELQEAIDYTTASSFCTYRADRNSMLASAVSAFVSYLDGGDEMRDALDALITRIELGASNLQKESKAIGLLSGAIKYGLLEPYPERVLRKLIATL
jgi:hypothetical protein